jgi:hypothetical protein
MVRFGGGLRGNSRVGRDRSLPKMVDHLPRRLCPWRCVGYGGVDPGTSRFIMVKIDPSEFPLVVQAVLIWAGHGKNAWPCRDESRLVNHFGVETTSRLLPILKSLESEFYSSDGWKVAVDQREMGQIAANQFKIKHPEIPDEIVQALEWCYTYDYK